MAKTTVFKKQCFGFLQVKDPKTWERLDTSEAYNKITVIDDEDCRVVIYTPKWFGDSYETVIKDFAKWLEIHY